MPTLDWILLAVVLASLLLGLWRGLVYEVLSLLNWIASFVLAQWWANELALRLPMGNASEPVRYAAAFVLGFVASLFALGLLAAMVSKLIGVVGLRPVDRILGALFGAVRALVLLLAVTVVVGMTPARSATLWRESNGAQALMAGIKALKPVLPEQFGKYLSLEDS
ncbi:MAG: CvpA family protein [Betaproteobacteria bacterium]